LTDDSVESLHCYHVDAHEMQIRMEAQRLGVPFSLLVAWYVNHPHFGEDGDESEEDSDYETAPDVADADGNGGDDPAASNDSVEAVVGVRIRAAVDAAEMPNAEEENEEEYDGDKDEEEYDGAKGEDEDKGANKGKGDKDGDGGGGSARTCA